LTGWLDVTGDIFSWVTSYPVQRHIKAITSTNLWLWLNYLSTFSSLSISSSTLEPRKLHFFVKFFLYKSVGWLYLLMKFSLTVEWLLYVYWKTKALLLMDKNSFNWWACHSFSQNNTIFWNFSLCESFCNLLTFMHPAKVTLQQL